MKNVSQFNKQVCNELRDELQAVLDKFGANLNFTIGNMKFSSTEVEIKISAKINGTKSFDDVILESRVNALGLVMEKNGLKLIRYDSKRWKMPFIYEKNGVSYKTTEEHAKFLFAA